MSKAIAELDFFGMNMNRDFSSSSIPGKTRPLTLFETHRSFRGVEEAMCEIKPELPKSASLCSETAPLTIFYNGTVSVFDVHRDMAENIIKAATGGDEGLSSVERPANPNVILSSESFFETFNRDEKLSRRMSLQRFLQKRKERLVSATPQRDEGRLVVHHSP